MNALTLAEAEDIVEQYAAEVEALDGQSAEERGVYFAQTYRAGQQHYLPAVCEFTAKLPSGRALDCGPGWGTMSLWLASHGWQVTAMDCMPIGTFMTERFVREIPCRYVEMQIERERLHEQFDLILMTQVVGHLKYRPDGALQHIADMLAPAGCAIISALNDEHTGRSAAFAFGRDGTTWRDIPRVEDGGPPEQMMNVCAYSEETFAELLQTVFGAVQYIQTEPVIIAVCGESSWLNRTIN